MRPLTREELLKIGASLEDYHAIFYTFFEMSSVVFSDQIPTAAVDFNERGGKPRMMLNEEFWNRHNFREKLFIICHECLHALLDHGIRNGMDVKGATHELVNKAQDITINHMIIDLFNFDREDLREWKKYCWIETCFTNPFAIKRNENFIYYLEKLIEDPKSKEENGPMTLDHHAGADGNGPGQPGETEESKKARESCAADIAKDLDAKDLESLINSLPGGHGAGTMRGVYEKILEERLKPLKLNIKMMIKRLKRTRLKYVDKDLETFIHEDRRFNDVLKRPDLSLPGTSIVQGPLKDRLLTAMFMDVSGSCIEYFPLFQQINAAFVAESNIFDLRSFIFDTSITEIVKGTPLRVGGGTYFHIIEEEILKLEKEYHRYPDCVIVVTDGDGTAVKPKAPTKWLWLFSRPYSKYFIPRNSRSWNVTDVELH